jgi:hypothetical protein
MIMNWFECKVSYEKMQEGGFVKKVTEVYLVDALSCTEAETRAIEHLKPYVSGELAVTGIKRARLSELYFGSDGDRYYKVRVFFVTLDERSGGEKKVAAQMLSQASSVREAIDALDEGMKGTLADYEIASVSETAIMDVIRYENT